MFKNMPLSEDILPLIYLCIYVYIHIHIHIHIHLHIHIHIQIHIHIHIHTYIHIQIHIQVHIQIHIDIHMLCSAFLCYSKDIHIQIQIHTHTYIYVYRIILILSLSQKFCTFSKKNFVNEYYSKTRIIIIKLALQKAAYIINENRQRVIKYAIVVRL